ncbi:MAG: prephenate dehydrogenase [Eubacteriales bacterium]|nr:prephenate dehydrogenase [Eubacteriales bacterium]
MDSNFTAGFIGLGLIGGSIAKAIKYFYPGATLLALSRTPETTDYALSEGIIDEALSSVGKDFSRCDYIFLCAPVESNVSYLEQLKPYLKESCILTDVGSTKTDIHEHVAALGLEEYFIGGHPMAGSEKTGLKNAKRHLIENAYYIITPSDKISKDKLEAYIHLVASLRAIPLVLDYREHDFVTAAISHLPHIIAAALVNLVHDTDSPNETMKTLAAGGFKDITRIASSSPEMWEQICTTNAGNIVRILDAYTDSLNTVRRQLSAKDSGAIRQLFADSREYRNSFSDCSSGPLKKAYMLYCDMVDEAGGIATLATILASSGISLKNIGIVHNREFEDAVLKVEFYDEESLKKSVELLRRYRYTVYER